MFCIAVLWPFFVFEFPTGQDIPNHVARVFVLLNADDPVIAQHFAVSWNPIPNLAWDVFGVVFGSVLSLNWTLKLFMIACFGITMGGVFALNRTIVGHWSWMALLAVPFTFHAGLTKGFLSFNLGIGLALVGCAFWVSQREEQWLRRLVIGTIFSVLLYYTHLVAWGVYGVFILGYGLEDLRSRLFKNGPSVIVPWLGRMARDGLQALPPILIVAGVSLFAGSGEELAGGIGGFDDPLHRILEARYIIDTGTLYPALGFLAIAGLYPFYLLFVPKVLIYAPRFSFSIGLLVLLFLALPNQLYSTHFVVWRLALAAAFVAMASGIPKQPIYAPLTRFSLALVLAITLGLSGWHAYSTYNSQVERENFLAMIERIPAGQTLFMVHAGHGADDIEFDRIGLYHVGAFAVINRKVMVQSLFSNPAQQTISYREPEFADFKSNGNVFVGALADAFEKRGISLEEHVHNFQWVATHGPSVQKDYEEIPLAGFTAVGSQGNFRLYCRVENHGISTAQCPDGETP